MITNNEVSSDEEKRLTQQGYKKAMTNGKNLVSRNM